MLGFFIGIILTILVVAGLSVQALRRWSQRLFGDLLVAALTNVETELSSIKSMSDLSAKVKELREELEALQAATARKQEEFDRRERDVEHKIGLERKRQELEQQKQQLELTASKREAIVQLREENLAADRKRFAEQMEFHDQRFTQEVTYLKEIIGDIAKRLPSAEIYANLSNDKK
ncbi:MAG: hypothetical protein ACR652_24480 [Methylocystis sp.]|uniref:hypothetical protein n=1 Tax=Methylocystis sp. TaxID=1911079 RepID=UPI003DA4324C